MFTFRIFKVDFGWKIDGKDIDSFLCSWKSSKSSKAQYKTNKYCIKHKKKHFFFSESIQVNGTRFIGDHGGISWAHVKSMGMGMAKKAGKMEQAYPFRTQKSAFINVSARLFTNFNYGLVSRLDYYSS